MKIAMFLMCLALVPPAVQAGEGLPWDIGSMPPETTAVYFRNANGGQRGVPVVSGDFNNDGFMDVAATPFSATTLNRTDNGFAEIVFGDGTLGNIIDTGDFDGKRLVIHGATARGLLGVETHVADFDGDGFDDLVLGSNHGAYRALAEGAGEAVILYGRAEWGDTVTELDLASLPTEQRARFIVGERAFDRLGSWFSIDDIDGDTMLDLVVGMDLSNGPSDDRANCGAAVIVWDVNGAHSDRPHLRVGDSETADAFTVIYGIDAFDLMGATLHVADLDGNSKPDLALTAGVVRTGLSYAILYGSNSSSGGGDGPDNTRTNAGESYILWDAGLLRQYRTLDLAAALPADVEMTTIHGESAFGYFGEELATGDVTGDGIDDLLAGGLLVRNRLTGIQTGAAYIFPGGSMLHSFTTIDLVTPPTGFISAFYGTEANAIAGDTLEAADINMDGIDDLFLAIPYGNPGGNRIRAGYTAVFYGGQAFPTLPDIIQADRTTTPDLMYATVLGAESGDLLAYSTSIGDFNNDGVADYVANAMNGDGFNNAYPSAGEYYIIDGMLLSRHAAAPLNPIAASGTMGDEVRLTWQAGQPVFGPIIGYDVVFRPEGDIDTVYIRVPDESARPSRFPSAGTILGIRTVMMHDSGEITSVGLAVQPPVSIPAPSSAATTWLVR